MAAQFVDFATVIVTIAPKSFRFSQVAGPLVDMSERFLVIGQRIDLARRRVSYVCEQVVFTPDVVLGLIIDERWEPDIKTPSKLVIDERWEIAGALPETLVHDERWEFVPDGTPGSLWQDERWEN